MNALPLRTVLTLAEIRDLLRRLDGAPADAIESDTVECKPWDDDPRARDRHLDEVREAVVCLANSQGGVILLGIADGKRNRRDAIRGVGALDAAYLRKQVYDGTAPHVLVEIEELIEPEGRVLVVRVPRGMPPHTTTKGVGRIRVGKECKPLTGPDLARLFATGGQRDLTAECPMGVRSEDLDREQIRRLRRTIETDAENRELSRLPEEELLGGLGLLRDGEPTLAAVLLLGRSAALARFAPQHEVVFLHFKTATRYDQRHDLRGPLLAVIDALERLLADHVRLQTIATEGFEELTVPRFTWWAAREAVLNALVHRDYFLHQSVQIELRDDRITIASPGGFVGGVTPENVLHHPPVRRNPLLASVCQTIGLVNRAGLGVNRLFEELLRLGKPMPRYDADEGHVLLTVRTATHPPFARFVAEETKAGRAPELDDLILLRGLTEQGMLDRWTGARLLQRTEEEAAARLASLRQRGLLLAAGRGRAASYRLVRALSDRLRGAAETDLDLPLDQEATRLRLQAVLAERGSLTNTDVRRISGLSRAESVRLMDALRDAGMAIVKGRGRGARWVPGPKLPPAPRPGSGRRRRRGKE